MSIFRKRFASLMTAAIMIFGLALYVPSGSCDIVAEAAAQADVEIQLKEMINKYKGKAPTSAQLYYGIQCKGFANWVYYQLYGDYIGTYPSSANYKINITKVNGKAVATEVGVIAPGKLTADSAKKLLSKAYPGDFIQMRRKYGGPHSAIVASVESDGIYMFDNNSDGKNKIKHYLYTWQEIATNSALSLYHAADYTTGHAYGAWTVTKPATCTASGQQTRKCTACEKTETKTIAAIGHKYAVKVVAPTCTEEGHTENSCTVCGYSYNSGSIPATGHHYVESAGSKGEKTFTCSGCSDTFTEVISELTEDPNGSAKGDVNDDGSVDISDVTITISYIRGKREFTEDEFAQADVNGDGAVDITDITMLISIVRGVNA